MKWKHYEVGKIGDTVKPIVVWAVMMQIVKERHYEDRSLLLSTFTTLV